MSVTINEIQALERKTREIEEQKQKKDRERRAKATAKTKAARRQFWEKLVAPILLIISVISALIVSFLSR